MYLIWVLFFACAATAGPLSSGEIERLKEWASTSSEVSTSVNGHTVFALKDVHSGRRTAYYVEKRLGDGENGIVYLADRLDGKGGQVALKHTGNNDNARKNTAREIKHLERLGLLYAKGHKDGRAIFTMQLAKGITLEHLYRARWKLWQSDPLMMRAAILRSVTNGIGWCFARLFQHEDTHMENIMITNVDINGVPLDNTDAIVMIDFGDGSFLKPNVNARKRLLETIDDTLKHFETGRASNRPPNSIPIPDILKDSKSKEKLRRKIYENIRGRFNGVNGLMLSSYEG